MDLLLRNGGTGWAKCMAPRTTSNGVHPTSLPLDRDPHNGLNCVSAQYLRSFVCVSDRTYSSFVSSGTQEHSHPPPAMSLRGRVPPIIGHFLHAAVQGEVGGPHPKFTSFELSLKLQDL